MINSTTFFFADLKNHQIRDFSNLFICHQCSRIYKSKIALSAHRRNYCGKEKRFACNLCSYRSYQKAHLISHRMHQHRIVHLTGLDTDNLPF